MEKFSSIKFKSVLVAIVLFLFFFGGAFAGDFSNFPSLIHFNYVLKLIRDVILNCFLLFPALFVASAFEMFLKPFLSSYPPKKHG